MTNRPVIFISAVSQELRSTRDLVAKTLHALGYEPRWQDIAPTDAGDLLGVLRKWIDQSDAVLQLVGHCYGFAPRPPSLEFSRCSYTQYEALYARKRGKPVYYLFIDDTHPTDGCGCEPKTLHDLSAGIGVLSDRVTRHYFALLPVAQTLGMGEEALSFRGAA